MFGKGSFGDGDMTKLEKHKRFGSWGSSVAKSDETVGNGEQGG